MFRFLTAHPPRLLVASFAAAILIGAIVLCIPQIITTEGIEQGPINALFMSTSAVCVTGLVVKDIGAEYTWFGQFVILVLIQIGGLGILTFSNFMLAVSGEKFDIARRSIVEQTHGSLPRITPHQILVNIIIYTFVVEGIGAVLLTVHFAQNNSVPHAIWLGVFHSVSAFCNAGFSLFSDSFCARTNNAFVNMVVMALIILGGLGFIVFADLGRLVRGWKQTPRPRLSLHSRVVLWTTGILIVGGAVLIFALEWSGAAMKGSWYKHILPSLFLSVTSRTAGFNTVDTAHLTNPTLLVVILLMIVGASPGSTGGGMKTTTLATLAALVRARARNRPDVEIGSRMLPSSAVARALAVASGYILAIIVAVVLLEVVELAGVPHELRRGLFLDHLFEVVSALGTVGLSTGVTPDLTSPGKLIIIACMFVGRLGPLIVASSLILTKSHARYQFPEESIVIG